jgi:guanylate kinase
MGKRGALFVLTGPSGVGKTTLRRHLLARWPKLSYSVSCTTRPPRPDERHAIDYHFVSRKEFEELIRKGELLEWAWVFGEGYGTPKRFVLQAINSGRDVLLEIDVQGAAKIRRRARSLKTEVHYLFILPPSLKELRERLKGRGTESPKKERLRLQGAMLELKQLRHFEYLVINRRLEEAVDALTRFIHAA